MTMIPLMKTTPTEILAKPYARRLVRDESGSYVATILEFPGCIAEGTTPQEALDRLESAAESWLTVALANGNQIREPIDFDGYSGKVALRIPRTLHRQVAEYAELENTSINQLLLNAISFYIGGKSWSDDVKEQLRSFVFPMSSQLTVTFDMRRDLPPGFSLNRTLTTANLESPSKGNLNFVPPLLPSAAISI